MASNRGFGAVFESDTVLWNCLSDLNLGYRLREFRAGSSKVKDSEELAKDLLRDTRSWMSDLGTLHTKYLVRMRFRRG